MDRSVDPSIREQLLELAQSLLSKSPSLESPAQEESPFKALEELGTLGELTAQSFAAQLASAGNSSAPLLAPAPAATPVAISAATAGTPPTATPSPTQTNAQTAQTAAANKTQIPPLEVPERYSGKNLQDDSVLRALMEYHRLHAPVVGAKTAPAPVRAGFAPAEIPIVAAKPKDVSTKKRSTRPTTPVLRSSDES